MQGWGTAPRLHGGVRVGDEAARPSPAGDGLSRRCQPTGDGHTPLVVADGEVAAAGRPRRGLARLGRRRRRRRRSRRRGRAPGARPRASPSWSATSTRSTRRTRAAEAAGIPIDPDADRQGRIRRRARGPRGDRPGATRITVLGAFGGPRLDHALANVLAACPSGARGRSTPCCSTRGCAIRSSMRPGPAARRSTPAGAVGDVVSLLPFGGDAEGITTAGPPLPPARRAARRRARRAACPTCARRTPRVTIRDAAGS